MFLMPLGIVPFWITGLLSLGLLGGGLYLGWAWYEGVLVGTGYLVSAIAMLVFTLLGRPLMLMVLGRKTLDTPPEIPPSSSHRLTRPDGTVLYVEEYGPAGAPTLLLTHGWGLHSAVWRYMKYHLTDRYRLVVWDLPGLGRSTGPTRPDYSLEKMAGDLEAVVEFCGPEPVVVLGHSIGGMIILTLCRLSPHLFGTRISALVLTNTTYINPVKTARFHSLLRIIQKPILEPLMVLQILLLPVMWVLTWLSYWNGTSHLATHLTQCGWHETSEQLDFACRFSLRASPAVLARGMLGMFRYDAENILSAIPVPVLVITGDRDQLTLPEAGEHIFASVPQGERAHYSPTGHLTLLEKNRQMDEAIGAFAAKTLQPSVGHSLQSDLRKESVPCLP